MPYNANIPQPTDQISDSQNDLLNNFQSINTLINVNHVTFDDPNQGKHAFVEMPQQAGAPATAIGEVGLFCLASAFNAGAPTLVYRTENNGPSVEIASALKNVPGWTFLPSGLLIKYGNFVVNAFGNGTTPLNFAGFPVYGTSILFSTFQVATAGPDPNLAINLDLATTDLATLGYSAVSRNGGVFGFPALVYYLTIGF
jgi:hypothetical protein